MQKIVDGELFDMTADEIAEWEAAQVAPSNPVPFSVSGRQGQLALLEAGYIDEAELLIASIEDDTERRRAQIEYGATMWERSNPFLQKMWSDMGGTDEQLDELFRHAITL